MKVNHDKLTPFDLQVLNEMALAPNKFSLTLATMDHEFLGFFKATWLGMQVRLQKGYSDTDFRQLSWRGQILVGVEHGKLLQAPIDPKKVERAEQTAVKVNQLHQVGGGGVISGVQHPNISPSLLQQQALAQYQRGATLGQMTRQAQQDSLNYQRQQALNQMMAPPSPQDKLFDHTIDELRALGFSHGEIAELKKFALGVGDPKSIDPNLIARVHAL